MIRLIDGGTISGKIAKDVFEKMWARGERPAAIVEQEGLAQVSDEGALEAAVAEVIAASPEQVATYRSGRDRHPRLVRGTGHEEDRGQGQSGRGQRSLEEGPRLLEGGPRSGTSARPSRTY